MFCTAKSLFLRSIPDPSEHACMQQVWLKPFSFITYSAIFVPLNTPEGTLSFQISKLIFSDYYNFNKRHSRGGINFTHFSISIKKNPQDYIFWFLTFIPISEWRVIYDPHKYTYLYIMYPDRKRYISVPWECFFRLLISYLEAEILLFKDTYPESAFNRYTQISSWV